MDAQDLLRFKQSLEGSDSEAFESDYGQWHAALYLCIDQSEGASKLTRCRHNGPLYVQRPFYPEGDDLAHIYLLHPPGGMVSGDHLQISVDVKAQAKALITTPGAARAYKARDSEQLQRQTVVLNLEESAVLEWFPLETIVYNQAHAALDTTVNLKDDSVFCAWEISCFGLPASNAPFEQGSFQQAYRIFRNGRPSFIDSLCLSAHNLERFMRGKACMNDKLVSGFFIISAIDAHYYTDALEDELLALIEDAPKDCIAMTLVGDNFVLRYLGDSAEQARSLFTQIWTYLRPRILQREASVPRIWLT